MYTVITDPRIEVEVSRARPEIFNQFRTAFVVALVIETCSLDLTPRGIAVFRMKNSTRYDS